jgi:hypothetical protein
MILRSWDLTPYYDHKQFRLKNEIEDILAAIEAMPELIQAGYE